MYICRREVVSNEQIKHEYNTYKVKVNNFNVYCEVFDIINYRIDWLMN